MLQLRKSQARGHANLGWLDSRHTFSFGDYLDRAHMGFGKLRVINEDKIQGGSGFDTHGHRDMEIISYVVDGALEHRDSMGTSAVIKPGEVQRMSAGTGVLHSEYNHLHDATTHFLQIWVLPERAGLEPSYEQKSFGDAFARGGLVLVASRDGREGSVRLHQDLDMYVVKSAQVGNALFVPGSKGRLWLQVVKGEIMFDSTMLAAGDGAASEGGKEHRLAWQPGSELILFAQP